MKIAALESSFVFSEELLFGELLGFGIQEGLEVADEVLKFCCIATMEAGIGRLLERITIFPLFVNGKDFLRAGIIVGFAQEIADQDAVGIDRRALLHLQKRCPLFGGGGLGADARDDAAEIEIRQQVKTQLFIQVVFSHLIVGAFQQHPVNFPIGEKTIGELVQPRFDRHIIEQKPASRA